VTHVRLSATIIAVSTNGICDSAYSMGAGGTYSPVDFLKISSYGSDGEVSVPVHLSQVPGMQPAVRCQHGSVASGLLWYPA